MEKQKKKIVKFIRRNGILVGSRAWGVSTDSSDYDYLVTQEVHDKILRFRGCKKLIEYHENKSDRYKNTTFYIESGGRSYNVICPITEYDYESWLWASACLKTLIHKEAISEKSNRVHIFKQLRMFYKNNLIPNYTGDYIPF